MFNFFKKIVFLGCFVFQVAAYAQNLIPGNNSDTVSKNESVNIDRSEGASPSVVTRSRQGIDQSFRQPVVRSIGKVTHKNVFQDYVKDVSGAELELFGHDLFRDVSSTFAPLDLVQVNADYVIGAGDVLQIRGWGAVSLDAQVTVERNGDIFLPKVGAVNVSGVKYRDLQNYLKKSVERVFNNFELSVSVIQSRAVQVYVVGHVLQPGTYTLSAMSTLLNALFVSGGPSVSGSMRMIQLKRGGQVVTTFDLYDMLLKGDKTKDVSLQDGDVIYIPEVGPLVGLIGNVKNPAIFELKSKKSSLIELLAWAGGLDSVSESRNIVVEKSVNNRYEKIAEWEERSASYPALLEKISVQGSDVVRIFSPGAVAVPVYAQEEFVTVAGEVKQAGVFRLNHGETLRELINRLGGVTDKAYVFATQFKRESVRRAQQEKLNEVADRFEKELEASAKQRIAGSTDKDNIASVSAELERQRQMAQKLRTIKSEGRVVLELAHGDVQVKNLPDMPLQGGDSIFIPRRPGTVDVVGAVYQQNTFIYRPERQVKDYLGLSGGLTTAADSSEIYVIRADGTARSNGSGWSNSFDNITLYPGDTIVVPEKIDRTNWVQSFKEWTTIFYQFGLGAAGLKVLK